MCNPGFGNPQPKRDCPDRDPETGWLTVSDGRLMLTPFQTLHNDAEGEAYAREHGEEYPFPNDYFDAADGAAYAIDLPDAALCSGVILVGYREPLKDHAVGCEKLENAARSKQVPVALWRSGNAIVQASELYRP